MDSLEHLSESHGEAIPTDSAEAVFNHLVASDPVTNAFMGRSGFLKEISSNNRSIDFECKYPKTETISTENYRDMYIRHPLASRVVEVMPSESWRTVPRVFDSEDNPDTPFVDSWGELNTGLRGESKFRNKKGFNPVWEYLKRVDILSGIGSFGALFLGFDDGVDLNLPVEPSEDRRLPFMRAFDQSCVQITKYDQNPASMRFGMPEEYLITFSSPQDSTSGQTTFKEINKPVHWSRVIHVSDNLGSNELFGAPRQRPVYNNLLDTKKLYGGSAEMYWKGAFPGISIESHPSLGADPDIDLTAVKTNVKNYMEGLQRYLALKGQAAKSLSPQVVNPSPQIEVQIDAICIQLTIPKRVFMGSERGELASSEDKESWNERVEARQESYLTPRLIVPFTDRLIEVGVLAEPEEYFIEWPSLSKQTDDEKAGVAVKRIHALAKYISGDVESVLHAEDMYTRFLDMDEDEAEAILKKAGYEPGDASGGDELDTGGNLGDEDELEEEDLDDVS